MASPLRRLVPAAIGLGTGLALAAAAGKSLTALLAGVSPFDATIYFGTVAATAVMAATGSILPAWRAARLDPTSALRSE